MSVLAGILFCTLVASPFSDAAAAGEWPYSKEHSNNNEEGGFTTAVLNVTYTDPGSGHVHTEKSEQGRFGRGHVGASAGVLVHVRGSEPGCSLPLVASVGVPPQEPWIALIRRGGCNFDVKVENAWRSNASAVIVYNNQDSTSLEKMPLSDGRNISGVFITKQRGEELARLVDNDTKVLLVITVGSYVPKQYTNINKTSVLFVSISFIVLMIISLAWLVFYYVQRFRYIHAKDRLSRRLCSAAKKALSKIPTKNIKSEDKEIQGDGECCAVCIEPYKVSDVLRILPCRHEFHKSCIDPWLLEHRTCPMCKMDILKHYGFVFTGSQESILHMEIEEVVGLGIAASHDTDSLHRRSLSPLPQIRPSDHQISGAASPDQQSHSSRSSTPDEMSPSLSSGQRLAASNPPSTADPPQRAAVCSTCGSDLVARSNTGCDTNACVQKSSSCDVEDCELESCGSSTTSPCHSSSTSK